MNDTYVEYMVRRKPNPLLLPIKVLIYFIAFIGIIFGLSGAYILLIPGIAAIALIFIWLPNMNLEFEYLYLDKELSVDKIMNKQKRKRVATIDLSKMDFMCPFNSHELDSYKARNAKCVDYTSKSDNARVYVIVYHEDNEEKLVSFEPNDEIVKIIKTVCPRKVLD